VADPQSAENLMQLPRLRFSLRTLLIITVLVAIPSAWLGKHWLRTRVQRPMVAKIKANGGQVYYDYQSDRKNFDSSKTPPGWAPLRAMLGDDFFATVKVAIYGNNFPPQIIDIEFEQLSDLEQIYINAKKVPETTIAKLASLKKLNSLVLADYNYRPEVFRKLADCPSLTHLTVFSGSLTSEHLRELKSFAMLTNFQWTNAPLTDDGLLAICELRKLKSLDLLWSGGRKAPPLTARGFQGLAQLQELEQLKLSGPADDAMAAIAKLPNVHSVQLWADELTDAGMLHLASLTKLVELKSDSELITDAGLVGLSKLQKLVSLELYSPKVTDAGLAQISGLTNIYNLVLNSPEITDAGLPALLPLQKLVKLELKQATLTDQGLQQLASLSKLKRLTITLGPILTIEGVNKLRASLPDCKFFDFQPSPGGGGSITEIP
jgi:hypothetical protein